MRACGACFFYMRTEFKKGECFNRPPHVFMVQVDNEITFVSQRPVVLEDDFCAFFNHKNEKPKPKHQHVTPEG